MTKWILNKMSGSQAALDWQTTPILFSRLRVLIFAILAGMYLFYVTNPPLFDIVSSTMSDAYIGVSVFVAATLFGFYTLDSMIKSRISLALQKGNLLQVPIAALLGALPGCGGAIVVVTQFVNGKMTFGALVAVLISTMGDAAFLLLAHQPKTALLVYGISLISGTLFGYAVNALHGKDYLKPVHDSTNQLRAEIPAVPSKLTHLFIVLLIPGVVLGLLEAMQIDSNRLFGSWQNHNITQWLGFAGSLTCVVVWMSQPLDSWSARFSHGTEIKHLKDTLVAETSFISVWVILGFLSYELLVYFLHLDFQSAFNQMGGLVIITAIVIGLVPGCGPQIVVTTLYINGVIPLSALLANSISNDGDALFPAIALAPEAAIKATLYSAAPAFMVGYLAYYAGW